MIHSVFFNLWISFIRVLIVVEKLARCCAVGQNATRGRISRMILASVVNASSCRRRGLVLYFQIRGKIY